MSITEQEQRAIAIHELREALEFWLHAYVGMYTIHYGGAKADAMLADPIEGKRIAETQALLKRTQPTPAEPTKETILATLKGVKGL